MNDACTRKPEGGKLTATHGGEIIRIYNGFFGFLAFLAHFDTEFQGVSENLEAGRRGGCFKDIKMRLGPRCSPLLVIIS